MSAKEITKEQAQFLLGVLATPGLALPLSDSKKMRLALETRENLEAIAEAKEDGN